MVFAIVSITCLSYAKEGEPIPPQEELKSETILLKKLISDSEQRKSDLVAKFKRAVVRFNEDLPKLKDPKDKSERIISYLEERIRVYDAMEEEVKFLSNKLMELATNLNNIIGSFGEKSKLAKKAEKKAGDLTKIRTEIGEIKKLARSLKSEEPKQGSPKYMEWYKRRIQIQANFRKKTGQFVRNKKHALLLKGIARSYESDSSVAIHWQTYSFQKNLVAEERIADLKTEREMAQDLIVYHKAIGSAYDTIRIGELVSGFDDGVGIVMSEPFPPLDRKGVDLSKIEIPEIKVSTLDEIIEFDENEYGKEIEKKFIKETQGNPGKGTH